MPRYFFHLVSQETTVRDHEGIEIVGDLDRLPESIIAEIITRITEQIRTEDPESHDLASDWWIEVVDEEGRTLGAFPVQRRSAAN